PAGPASPGGREPGAVVARGGDRTSQNPGDRGSRGRQRLLPGRADPRRGPRARRRLAGDGAGDGGGAARSAGSGGAAAAPGSERVRGELLEGRNPSAARGRSDRRRERSSRRARRGGVPRASFGEPAGR